MSQMKQESPMNQETAGTRKYGSGTVRMPGEPETSKMSGRRTGRAAAAETIESVVNQIPGRHLREKRGGKFHFRMYMTPEMSAAPLEDLELGVRSYNCLKRAGYNTIGGLAGAVAGGTDLGRIRNCGRNSIREIMESLFLYQYHCLPAERRETYLAEVARLNTGENT